MYFRVMIFTSTVLLALPAAAQVQFFSQIEQDVRDSNKFVLNINANQNHVVATQPIDGDPFKDYRIDNCEKTRGFGYILYSTSKGYITSVTDICFDAKQGGVVSAETISGFQLVKDSKNGRLFEILSSGNSENSRTSIKFAQDDATPGCGPKEIQTIYYSLPYGTPLSRNDASYAYAIGYTIPATSNSPKKSESKALLSINYFSQAELPQQTTDNLPFSGDMYGDLSFNENEGTFSVTRTSGFSFGEAEGQLNLKAHDNGQVQISGRFTAENPRIAGHEQNEWMEMTVEIPYMRGHILGNEGEVLKSFGIARGSYIDASGATHDFRAQVRFVSCFTNFMLFE